MRDIKLSGEIVRYIIAGGIAFTVDFSILFVLTEYLGVHYLISALAGYLAGLMIAYSSNVFWVFSYRKYKNVWAELAIFKGIVLAGIVLNELTMLLFVEVFSTDYLYAKLFAAVGITILNFAAKKKLLFSPPKSIKGESESSSDEVFELRE